jgi:hypothetical protein
MSQKTVSHPGSMNSVIEDLEKVIAAQKMAIAAYDEVIAANDKAIKAKEALMLHRKKVADEEAWYISAPGRNVIDEEEVSHVLQ